MKNCRWVDTVESVKNSLDVSCQVQDLLVYATKGISAVTTTLRQEGVEIQPAVNHMITLNLFTTITNANLKCEELSPDHQETLSRKICSFLN